MGLSDIIDFKGAAQALRDKDNQRFEKAKIITMDEEEYPVQFNPSEYSIIRKVEVKDKPGVGKEGNSGTTEVVKSYTATLKVALYFDGYTDLKSATFADALDTIGSFGDGILEGLGKVQQVLLPESRPLDPDVLVRCDDIISLMRFKPDQHEPPDIHFVWGVLDFVGKITNCTVAHTMFAPNGIPVRTKMTLEITGEENAVNLRQILMPQESPDRTKERMMPYGDQLWMIADKEYGDPGEWKTIAKANNILNPRKIDRAIRLKVPSIR